MFYDEPTYYKMLTNIDELIRHERELLEKPLSENAFQCVRKNDLQIAGTIMSRQRREARDRLDALEQIRESFMREAKRKQLLERMCNNHSF